MEIILSLRAVVSSSVFWNEKNGIFRTHGFWTGYIWSKLLITNTGHLSCDNATAIFTTQKTINLWMSRRDIKTGCAFYHVPDHSSWHWTSWQMQTFYATNVATFMYTTTGTSYRQAMEALQLQEKGTKTQTLPYVQFRMLGKKGHQKYQKVSPSSVNHLQGQCIITEPPSRTENATNDTTWRRRETAWKTFCMMLCAPDIQNTTHS